MHKGESWHLEALQKTTGESAEMMSNKTIHTLLSSSYSSGQYSFAFILYRY